MPNADTGDNIVASHPIPRCSFSLQSLFPRNSVCRSSPCWDCAHWTLFRRFLLLCRLPLNLWRACNESYMFVCLPKLFSKRSFVFMEIRFGTIWMITSQNPLEQLSIHSEFIYQGIQFVRRASSPAKRDEKKEQRNPTAINGRGNHIVARKKWTEM